MARLVLAALSPFEQACLRRGVSDVLDHVVEKGGAAAFLLNSSAEAFHDLRLLWESRQCGDEFLGSLLNAYIANGRRVRALPDSTLAWPISDSRKSPRMGMLTSSIAS